MLVALDACILALHVASQPGMPHQVSQESHTTKGAYTDVQLEFIYCRGACHQTITSLCCGCIDLGACPEAFSSSEASIHELAEH